MVSLQWHVDYWNDLSVGADGRWRDPFSSPENTERQRRYNVALRGTSAVYTPQAVVDGAGETIGSRERDVMALIEATRRGRQSFDFVFDPTAAGWRVSTGRPRVAAFEVVELIDERATYVRGGENAGRRIEARHIASGAQVFVPDGDGVALIGAPEADKKRLVIAKGEAGEILGGAYVPGAL